MKQNALWTLRRIHEQSPQLRVVRHQFIQRDGCLGCVCALAAHPSASISRYRVQPNCKSLGILDVREMAQGTEEHLLHGVFRIFWMAADLHAEGVNRVLQQTERLFNRLRSVAAQQFGRLSQFRSHLRLFLKTSSLYRFLRLGGAQHRSIPSEPSPTTAP